jgi:undecaprenyl-diphosphatase
MTAIEAADERLLLWITDLAGRSSILDDFMRLVVNDYFVPVILSLILLGFWFVGLDQAGRERNQRTVLRAGFAIGLSSAVVAICNHFFERPRPFVDLDELWINANELVAPPLIFYPPTDSALPSNIAAVVFAIAAAGWIANRRLGIVLCIPAVLVCFARVMAGVHYPLDIVTGAAIGIIAAYVIHDVVMPMANPLIEASLRVARKLCLA